MSEKPKKGQDSVLDYECSITLFNGTPPEILQWLREHPEDTYKVAVNSTRKILLDREYIEKHSLRESS